MAKLTHIQHSEVHKVFPKAKSVVLKNLKLWKDAEKELEKKRKVVDKDVFKAQGFSRHLKTQQRFVFSIRHGEEYNKVLENIERLEKLLKRYNFDPTKSTYKEVDLDAIKEIPISNFIEFDRRKKANCIWHEEKTGSLHYNEDNNTVKCFGCEFFGSVIDVIMQQEGVDFKEAIKILSN